MNKPNAAAQIADRHARAHAPTQPVAPPVTRREALELRDLLEANLAALHALHEEQRRMIELGLRTMHGLAGGEPGAANDLRHELRALTSPSAPWVNALGETRALLYVALRELIIGQHEAELSLAFTRQPTEPHIDYQADHRA
jgi:hypothetical protein